MVNTKATSPRKSNIQGKIEALTIAKSGGELAGAKYLQSLNPKELTLRSALSIIRRSL